MNEIILVLLQKINRPGGRYTRYCYDKLGRVIRTDYYDKTYENFTYNKNGALIEVENQYGKVKKFERDSLGRITKEWQGRHWISNQYDELGNCIQTVSSFGANILTSRNEMGQATQVAAYLDKRKAVGVQGWNIMLWGRRLSVCSLIISVVHGIMIKLADRFFTK